MALKNTKIVRDIAQTYNKLLSSKADTPASHRAQELPETIQENLKEYRYDVSNATNSSPIMPKVDFVPKKPEQIALFEMNHLQPATYPKHIKGDSNPGGHDVWQLHKISKSGIRYPKELGRKPVTGQIKTTLVTETFKRNLLRGPTNIVSDRGYATSPFMIVSRSYTKKKDKNEKCDRPKKQCRKGQCPPIPQSNKDCDRSTGSNCEHLYIDPKCTKKLAPYPSYSETCARELEGDPSECYQCPWKKCGGTEAIKPPKRNYHTTVRPFNMAMIPGHKPCKAPPPRCGKKKDPKCPGGDTEKKKKKCDGNDNWTQAYALWSAKENVVPFASQDVSAGPAMQARVKDEKDVRDKFPYDKRQADYDYVRQRPCADNDPKCKKKKHKRVPDSCDTDPYKRCAPQAQTATYELLECSPRKDPTKCPLREKGRCPDKSNVIDPRFKPRDPCCSEAKKNKRKGTRSKPKVFVPEKRNY